jgi:hypothetical protein
LDSKNLLRFVKTLFSADAGTLFRTVAFEAADVKVTDADTDTDCDVDVVGISLLPLSLLLMLTTEPGILKYGLFFNPLIDLHQLITFLNSLIL